MDDLPKSDSHQDHVWERGFDEHERLQRERLAKLTLPEKLEWLEESQRVVEQMKKNSKVDKSATHPEQKPSA